TASELPASVSILDSEQLEQLAVQHFEELVNAVPNLNWSGDGHRARYFQIRGVGELEQYQGAPNPSVGFLIDDIDFSGIGTVATLFDLQRVEILRGPQGTRYGANALAGLIYMQSAEPTADWGGRVQVSAADDDALSAGLALGGPLTGDDLTFRLSVHHHESDGFRNNPYLGRDNTNGRDETTVRGRLRWLPNDRWQVDLATMVTDIDNGYDAFALDNSYTMLADRPGKDAQESIGASVRVEFVGSGDSTFTSITALADSDIVFSYDADWGNTDSWAPVTYDYISVSDRKRKTLSQEIRLATAGWLIGAYALRLDDHIVTVNQGDYYDPFYDFADSLDDTLGSEYEATNVALFGQYEHLLGDSTRLSLGLRAERRTTDYVDTAGLRAGPSESMSGGELTLSHDHSAALTSYVSLAQGYKAGGFNLGFVPDERREFAAEKLWNLEVGIKTKSRDESLQFNASVFASRRDDQQVRTSFQLVPGDPASFVFFTDNAAQGEAIGFEADVRWSPDDVWEMYANIGLLEATFETFATPQVDLSGREQAHAPDFMFAIGGRYRHPQGLFVRVDITARDEFFFDVSHDQKSTAYELVNARIGYEAKNWSVQMWARNVFDEDYAVRGFYFGNEPPDFPNTLYTRLGDPRQIGVTFDRSF
ncbi:MAG: TonB-dependent receptor, partial [Gammaproteobacteria bacterium]|nr:TonB-dependent receptor [Gammaproteobacteria bacterium]